MIQPPAPQRVAEPQRIELKDAKDGTGDLLYETSGFTARIAPDGSVAFKDKRVSGLTQLPWLPMQAPMAVPSLQASLKICSRGAARRAPPPSDLDQGLAPPETKQVIPEVSRYLADPREGCRAPCTNFMDLVLPVQVLGRFDVSDELTRFSGQDPSRFQKATFLAATRDRRLQMAVKMHAANIRRADAELPIAVAGDRVRHTPDAQGAPRDPGVARQGDGPEHAGGRERGRQHQRLRRPLRRRRRRMRSAPLVAPRRRRGVRLLLFQAAALSRSARERLITCAAVTGRATPS